jgi:hypothetical protein
MCAEIVDVMLAASFCRPAIKNDSSAILRSGKRFIMRADEKPLVKESGYAPTLPCLAYKQKWPPKKDDHSCCGKLFEAAGVF